MQITLYIGVLVYMYLSTSVAAKIGVNQVGTTSSFIIVLLSLHALTAYDINKTVAKFKAEFFIILLAFIIIVLKYFMGDFDGINGAILFLIVPTIFSILLGRQDIPVRINLRMIVIFFFITECFLALYERATLVNMFPYEELSEYYTVESLGFRSSAFLGHPLANALCVSTIMGFILISPMKLIQRMLLVGLGYIALLSFNARGALLIWTILIPTFLLYFSQGNNRKELFTLPMLLLFTVFGFLLYNIIFTQGYGDRFFQGELMDGSALTRLDVFDAFSNIKGVDFWLGSSSRYEDLVKGLVTGGYENSYIIIVIKYGIVLAIFLFIAFLFLLKRLIKPYDFFKKIVIFISFIVVGSTNNSLASSTPWMFFILCANAFLDFNYTQVKPNKNKKSYSAV